MSGLLPNSGNHMVEAEERDRKPNPDDYCKCDECGEQTHVDHIIQATDDKEICRCCFEKMENEFFCNECCEEFLFKGVPAVCPRCGSYRIWHEFTGGANFLIKEKQKQRISRIEAEPSLTANVFALMTGEGIHKNSAA